MAYNELIKNFERIRDNMRDFYVYGFKTRNDYSPERRRSYDDERRRVESWLGEYVFFKKEKTGKSMFISVDSRNIPENPLYKAYRAKTFTDIDITLHFYIMDILSSGEEMAFKDIIDSIHEDYLSEFEDFRFLDESTVRKKMNEHVKLGLLNKRRAGRQTFYRRNDSEVDLESWKDAVSFYSQAHPLGVVGSFINDKYPVKSDCFSFKHNYILAALDQQIMLDVLLCMNENAKMEVRLFTRKRKVVKRTVFPLRIYISSQNGRQYALVYDYEAKRPNLIRLDHIRKIRKLEREEDSEKYEHALKGFSEYLWGASSRSAKDRGTDRVRLVIRAKEDEEYIVNRLEREKRIGTVKKLDEENYLFTAEVYDAREMLPWIRTFTGRIVSFSCTNEKIEDIFREDISLMNSIYLEAGHDF